MATQVSVAEGSGASRRVREIAYLDIFNSPGKKLWQRIKERVLSISIELCKTDNIEGLKTCKGVEKRKIKYQKRKLLSTCAKHTLRNLVNNSARSTRHDGCVIFDRLLPPKAEFGQPSKSPLSLT